MSEQKDVPRFNDFMLGWKFCEAVNREAHDARDVGRLVTCDFFPFEFHKVADSIPWTKLKPDGVHAALVGIREVFAGMADPSAEIARLRADVQRKDEALKEVFSVISVLFGRGPDAVIPERVDTPIGIPIKLREIMAGVTAALADTADKTNEGG